MVDGMYIADCMFFLCTLYCSCRLVVGNLRLFSSGYILMHWSAFLRRGRRGTKWGNASFQRFVKTLSNLSSSHISNRAIQPSVRCVFYICFPLWQKHTRYDGQVAVFGSAFQEKLEKQKYFLVRACLVFVQQGAHTPHWSSGAPSVFSFDLVWC